MQQLNSIQNMNTFGPQIAEIFESEKSTQSDEELLTGSTCTITGNWDLSVSKTNFSTLLALVNSSLASDEFVPETIKPAVTAMLSVLPFFASCAMSNDFQMKTTWTSSVLLSHFSTLIKLPPFADWHSIKVTYKNVTDIQSTPKEKNTNRKA